MYIPEKGDIVFLNFDPSAGKEMMKRRPAFVLSRKEFNQHKGFVVVAPITSVMRNMKLAVTLPDTLSTIESILIHQIKSLNFAERETQFIEQAPQSTTAQVTKLAKIIIS